VTGLVGGLATLVIHSSPLAACAPGSGGLGIRKPLIDFIRFQVRRPLPVQRRQRKLNRGISRQSRIAAGQLGKQLKARVRQ